MFGLTQNSLKERADYYWATAQFLQAAANLASYGDHTEWCGLQSSFAGVSVHMPAAQPVMVPQDDTAKETCQEATQVAPKPTVDLTEPPKEEKKVVATPDSKLETAEFPFKSPQEMFDEADKQDRYWREYNKKKKEQSSEVDKKMNVVEDTKPRKHVESKKMPRPPSYPPTGPYLARC